MLRRDYEASFAEAGSYIGGRSGLFREHSTEESRRFEGLFEVVGGSACFLIEAIEHAFYPFALEKQILCDGQSGDDGRRGFGAVGVCLAERAHLLIDVFSDTSGEHSVFLAVDAEAVLTVVCRNTQRIRHRPGRGTQRSMVAMKESSVCFSSVGSRSHARAAGSLEVAATCSSSPAILRRRVSVAARSDASPRTAS